MLICTKKIAEKQERENQGCKGYFKPGHDDCKPDKNKLMADRVIRSNILTSDTVNGLSWCGEIFYRRLMSVVDDYGRYEARTSILRASLFPLKLNQVSEADIVKWKAECAKTGLVSFYEVDGKEYLEILKFGQRLRIMKSKYPPQSVSNPPHNAAECDRKETETETETETEKANASGGVAKKNELEKYKSVEKDMNDIADFIIQNKPLIVDPYKDLWNLFAEKHNRPQITNISDKRRKKLLVRIGEPAFDFVKVLKKARISDFLLSGNFFSFDWVIENPGNYLKVLEGNYDNKIQTFRNGQKQSIADRHAAGLAAATESLAASLNEIAAGGIPDYPA